MKRKTCISHIIQIYAERLLDIKSFYFLFPLFIIIFAHKTQQKAATTTMNKKITKISFHFSLFAQQQFKESK